MEKCFHRKVRYLVTLRHVEGKKEGKEQTAASPDTPEGGVKSGGKSAGTTSQSPLEGSKSEVSKSEGSKSKKGAHGIRGAKFVEQSVSVRVTTWPRYVFSL